MTWDGLVTFYGSLQAMRAEKVLGRTGLACRLIPGPRDISPHCGVALQFRLAEADEVEDVLRRAGVQIEAVHAYRLDAAVAALAEGR
jgi:Protein of unknown function (DUF3343)